MISNEEVTQKQKEFEKIRNSPNQEIININNEWKKFLEKFTIERIRTLKLDEYVLGKDETYKESFCHWIENRLNLLGNMHGATAFKFGIYYGKTDSDSEMRYRWTKKFGKVEDKPETVFIKVRNEILNLLLAGKEQNYEKIKDNQLSPMFKGKILFLYYPDKFLNILSKEHLNYFLNELSIPYPDDLDETAKRKVIIDYKNNNPLIKNWSNSDFSRFLYLFFRPPKDLRTLQLGNYFEDVEEQEEITAKSKELTKQQKIEYLKSMSPEEEIIIVKRKSFKRDNVAIAFLKEIRGFKCQFCGISIPKKNGEPYIEGAHIDPKHKKGSELSTNILILCPNHHKEFDLGKREIISRDSNKIILRLNDREYNLDLELK